MAVGQCMLAFGVLMSSFGSLHDFHCNPETRWRNTCRAQGFFVLAGLHVTITTYDVSVVCCVVWKAQCCVERVVCAPVCVCVCVSNCQVDADDDPHCVDGVVAESLLRTQGLV